MALFAVSHSYRDGNGVWHEVEFVNLNRFKTQESARQFISEINWVFHHKEGEAEVFLYPGHLCNPPVETDYLETQKMFLRLV